MKIKNLIMVVMLLFITSCAWMPPAYDNNEYLLFAEIETNARYLLDECNDPKLAADRIDVIRYKTEILTSYTFFRPGNYEMYFSSEKLVKQVGEMDDRYNNEKPPSKVYCKIKTKIIIGEIHTLMEATGRLQDVD